MAVAAPAFAWRGVTTDAGGPVRWPSRCVGYYLNDLGSADLGFDDYRSAVQSGMNSWFEGEAGVQLSRVGLTSVGASPDDGRSVIVVHDDAGTWPYDEGQVALTTLQYDVVTGDIVDADVELNGEHFVFGTEADANRQSLSAVIRHEAGHMLGFGHSSEVDSVMYAGQWSLPDLSDDDREGLIARYGSLPADCTELDFGDYYPSSLADRGCTASSSAGSSAPPWALLLLLVGLFVRRFRLRTTAAALTLLVALPAGAFLPYTTDGGEFFRWRTRALTFVTDGSAPPEFDASELHQVVLGGLQVWGVLDCQGGTDPFVFRDGGLDAAATVGHDGTNLANNENLIRWINTQWPYDRSYVALTTIAYDTYTGEVVDTDIEFNAERFRFSTAGAADRMDVLNTVVHEAGHVLGLDHSQVLDATMYFNAPEGEIEKRTLAQDDIDGFCAMYGPDAPPYLNRSSSTGTDATDGESSGSTQPGASCTASPGSSAPAGLWALLCLVLAGLFRRRAVVIVLVASVLWGPSPAQAFNLYTTDDTQEPLRWFSTTATVVFDEQAPGELDREQARQVVFNSYQVWSVLLCADAEGVPQETPFTFVDGGYVAGRTVGQDPAPGAQNENLVVWVQSGWEHGDEVLALTSLTFDTVTGEIVDADMELNDEKRYSFNPVGQQYDVANTVVHEVGHFLGLDHSAIQIATMFSQALPSETNKRDLTQDDVNGFCALYGPLAPARRAPETVTTSSGCSSILDASEASTAGLMVLCGVLLCALTVREPNRSARD